MGPDVAFQAIDVQISQTDLLAGTAQNFVAPMDGYWDSFDTVVQAAVTTGGTLTINNNPQAVYSNEQVGSNSDVGYGFDTIVSGGAFGTPAAVAGLVQTIANSAAVGAKQTTKATAGDPSLLVKKGDIIQVKPASFATAGAINCTLRFRSEPLTTLAPLVG